MEVGRDLTLPPMTPDGVEGTGTQPGSAFSGMESSDGQMLPDQEVKGLPPSTRH